MTHIVSNTVTFETRIQKRMERFHYLLENAKFQFKQYQYDGVKWCISNELRPQHHADIDTRGGFIADEMGLGKTITMIGTMFTNYLPRTLIVVPRVLINQWFNTIYTTSGHKALLFYGKDKKNITFENINKSTIVLTTYNTLLPDNCILKNVTWNRVIFDEAHHLRNSNTRCYRNCKQIKARIRWLVTGTPIQNKKQDFYNLCNVAGIKPSFYKNNDNLHIIQRNFVLRRTKQLVGIDLPPVNYEQRIVDWKNPKEMMLAEQIHSLIPEHTHVSSSTRTNIAKVFEKGGLLVALLRARQTCIMANLMYKNIEPFYKMGLIDYDLMEALSYSSKLDAVIQLILERKDNRKGKIVFCQFKSEIDAIAERLRQGGMLRVVIFDGRNSCADKFDMLARQPVDALVVQIQSGCEGLNLQHNFSEVYFVSPHWNPCIEDQAIARCHRIGQTKSVDVFKFEMTGFKKEDAAEINPITLETYVNKIQDIKRNNIRHIFGYQ